MDSEMAKVTEEFAREIYEGKLHSKQIHYGMYDATSRKLISGIMSKYTKSFGYTSPANATLDFIQTNIFAFSGAKTMTQFEAFSKLLVKDGKKIATFKEFKDAISAQNIRFNERYLQVEYDSAIAQGQMAARWQEIQENREGSEYLEYRTAGDERVRASHKALDKKVFHIDDKILDRIYPPNDWNCRCTMVQVADPAQVTPPSDHDHLERQASIPKYFRNNVGKTGMVYTDGHPYFKGIPKTSQLKAVDHYNMWDPQRIYSKPKKLSAAPTALGSISDFKAWHKRRIKTGPGKSDFAFECKPLNGLYLTFDEDLYKRITTNKKYLKEKRYQLTPHLEETIKAPDEIWSMIDTWRKKENLTVLIKYYDDKPFVVVVKSSMVKDPGYIRISSFYQLEKLKDLGRFRNGILRYKK
jgi:SPP1 gp7 family putative phage head morphogenesis protein